MKIHSAGLRLSVDADQVHGDLICHADKAKIHQVLRNFLTNAIKFSRKNGLIRINVKTVPISTSVTPIPTVDGSLLLPPPVCTLVIEVQDEGIGIAEEHMSQLFEQYVQFDAKKNQRGMGSGLGLWLSKEIMHMHLNGGIGATSELGKGSNFFLTLPCYDKYTLDFSLSDSMSSSSSHIHSTLGGRGGGEGDGGGGGGGGGADRDRMQRSDSQGSHKSMGTVSMDLEAGTKNMSSPIEDHHIFNHYEDGSSTNIPHTRSKLFGKERVASNEDLRCSETLSTTIAEKTLRPAVQSVEVSIDLPIIEEDEEGHDEPLAATIVPVITAERSVPSIGPPSAAIVSEHDAGGAVGEKMPGVVAAAIQSSSLSLSSSGVPTKSVKKRLIASLTGTLKVLVADDVDLSRKMVGRVISSLTKDVQFATNGEEAVHLVRENVKNACPFDVVLVDYHMPKLNGDEAVRLMRAEGYAGVILMVTGVTSTHQKQSMIAAGCNAVLEKPLNLRTFRDAICGLWSNEHCNEEEESDGKNA